MELCWQSSAPWCHSDPSPERIECRNNGKKREREKKEKASLSSFLYLPLSTFIFLLLYVINIIIQVLVSGCSAGGAAVVANVDYVNSLLPENSNRVLKGHVDAGISSTLPPHLLYSFFGLLFSFILIFDLGWFMLATPFAPVTVTMQGYLEIGAKLWGGIPNIDCAAAYPLISFPSYFV